MPQSGQPRPLSPSVIARPHRSGSSISWPPFSSCSLPNGTSSSVRIRRIDRSGNATTPSPPLIALRQSWPEGYQSPLGVMIVETLMLLIVLAGFLLVLGRHLGRPRRRPEGTDLVAQQDLKDEAIRAVRSWVESLPAGAAQLIEEQVPYEYVVRIVPRNTRSLGVQFRIGDNGTFGLYVSAIRIEDLPLSAQYLVEICEAVKQGRVEE